MCVRLSVYVRVCVRVQFNCMFVYFCVFVFTSIVRRRHFFKLPSARTIFMLIRRISVNYFTVKNSIWLSLHSVWFVYPTDLSSFSLKSLLLLMKPNNFSMTVIRFYCCWCWNLWNSMNYFRTWNFPILEIACRIGIQIIHLIKKKTHWYAVTELKWSLWFLERRHSPKTLSSISLYVYIHTHIVVRHYILTSHIQFSNDEKRWTEGKFMYCVLSIRVQWNGVALFFALNEIYLGFHSF